MQMVASEVLDCAQIDAAALTALLSRYGLRLRMLNEETPIPGSYWGDSEAGLIGDEVLVRPDTPVHSLLHEACHYICMDDARRRALHTDAAGDYDEEGAVCYLQILLSDYLPGVGRTRLFADMDAWGYSFRLGSSHAWFERDAQDARQWLLTHGLIDADNIPTWRVRE